jgi:hypothetical protein
MSDRIVALLVIINYGDDKAALLQQRGKIDPETKQKETWAGAHQVTVVGRVNKGETPRGAIIRELGEELALSEDAIEKLEPQIDEVIKFKNGFKVITMFKAETDRKFLREVRRLINQKRLKIIKRDFISRIKTLRPKDRAAGVTNSKEVKMFPEEKNIVGQFLA